jgi:2-amino-4-hydroxy-6-hydroxymethyldihydropteridine diphosphokinase
VTRALLALGSNLGDRVSHLREAIEAMPDVAEVSPVYETDPIGGPDEQGAYLNLVVRLDTQRSPRDLLELCRSLEEAANRVRRERWGPRTLDVDVLFYDDVEIHSPELTIPHPRLAERRFVLAPLAEVAPERCPPGWQDTLPAGGVHPRGPLP